MISSVRRWQSSCGAEADSHTISQCEGLVLLDDLVGRMQRLAEDEFR